MRVLKVLGFIFSWILPFGVVYLNHIAFAEGGYDVDMLGLMIVMILVLSLLGMINNRVKIWDIQDRHKIFRLNWNNGKKIVITVMITWGAYTIEDSLPKIQWSLVLISACFIIGWILTLLGNIKKNKVSNSS